MQIKIYALIQAIRNLSFVFTLSYSTTVYAYDPVDCLGDISKVDPEITVGLAARLCSGSWISEPVKYYQNVSEVDDSIPRGIAIDLCAGTEDSEKTIACYAKAAT
ncbi:hypothetical protein [Methylobacillus flagellatus]|uniref:Uncharacterized protein n=1 Tax=Methylobacillus flagellatus (strain ATCC 51484 / DSM 6875 / VKM B-1610 / KT) TaxID=265072 RepID=Q1H019_METFK|nr:hypothetical protein [Methylobacillus flagellatus]ABE50168.1 hypothetical protein Mfla_1901 [Methylobacillus flagellatus KT]